MKFTAVDSGENILNSARQLGYRPLSKTAEELSCIKCLMGRDYPRFHLFIKKRKEDKKLIFNLHLDQKKPSYPGSRAHSGEYAGEVVEKEARRIIELINKNI